MGEIPSIPKTLKARAKYIQRLMGASQKTDPIAKRRGGGHRLADFPGRKPLLRYGNEAPRLCIPYVRG